MNLVMRMLKNIWNEKFGKKFRGYKYKMPRKYLRRAAKVMNRKWKRKVKARAEIGRASCRERV